MSHTVAALTSAVAFTWLGLVLGVSWLETPLKFKALRAADLDDPLVTRLGVGIGALVFTWLNIIELVLAVVIVVAVWSDSPTTLVAVFTVIVAVLLAVQLSAVRFFLNRHTDRELAKPVVLAMIAPGTKRKKPKLSRSHRVHIGFEVVKSVFLAALGAAALSAV